jgi:hypothetical protein
MGGYEGESFLPRTTALAEHAQSREAWELSHIKLILLGITYKILTSFLKPGNWLVTKCLMNQFTRYGVPLTCQTALSLA